MERLTEVKKERLIAEKRKDTAKERIAEALEAKMKKCYNLRIKSHTVYINYDQTRLVPGRMPFHETDLRGLTMETAPREAADRARWRYLGVNSSTDGSERIERVSEYCEAKPQNTAKR